MMRNIFQIVFMIISSFLFPVLGIIGYYCDIKWLLIITFIALILTILTKYLNHKSIISLGISIIIGVTVANIFGLDKFFTAMVAACYEWIITSLYGYLMMFIAILKSSDNK